MSWSALPTNVKTESFGTFEHLEIAIVLATLVNGFDVLHSGKRQRVEFPTVGITCDLKWTIANANGDFCSVQPLYFRQRKNFLSLLDIKPRKFQLPLTLSATLKWKRLCHEKWLTRTLVPANQNRLHDV